MFYHIAKTQLQSVRNRTHSGVDVLDVLYTAKFHTAFSQAPNTVNSTSPFVLHLAQRHYTPSY